MSDTPKQLLSEWVETVLHVHMSAEALVSSTRLVASRGDLLHICCASLPFDTDPTGFRQCLETLTRRNDENV